MNCLSKMDPIRKAFEYRTRHGRGLLQLIAT
jgi:hypothetical protein